MTCDWSDHGFDRLITFYSMTADFSLKPMTGDLSDCGLDRSMTHCKMIANW